MYVNPYDNLSGGRWIRTNFHTHAGTGAGTCGRNPVDAVAALYRELGYGALCLSNHDLYTEDVYKRQTLCYSCTGVVNMSSKSSFVIRLSDTDKAKIRWIAAKDNRSMTNMIDYLIKKEIRRYETENGEIPLTEEDVSLE